MSFVFQAVGNTASALGTYKAGQEQAASYKYAAAQDEYNARLQAKESAAAEDAARRQNRQHLASLSAAMAENGLSGGSFDRIYAAGARNLEQDAQNLRYQGMSQWAGLKNSAAMNRFNAQQAKRNARFNTLLSLHGGAAQTLSSAANYYGWGAKGGGAAAGSSATVNNGLNSTFFNTSWAGGNKSTNAKLSLF